MPGSAVAKRRTKAGPERRDVAAVLLEEFGGADARARDESWRYSKTALRALAQLEFAPADPHAELPAALIARFDWAETRGRRLVFVNGTYSTAHSDGGALAGVAIDHAAHSATLTFADSAELVHLVFASTPSAQPVRWNARLDIRVQSRGARVIEHHVGVAGTDVLGALQSHVEIAGQAEAQSTTLCDLPDSVSLYRHNNARIVGDGAFATAHALFGGRLQRHEAIVELAGSRSRYSARGAFVLRGRQHADVHLDVCHLARDTTSDVVWRGVADQRARGILHGAITVAAGADGADARLQTKNLLLSPHAEIDAQPVLEIHADEVKASHGATVGQLDEIALFYLRSRGIPAAAARGLLIGGFCREVFADIADADFVRARLEAAIGAQLPLPGEGVS
jgi:Fe-S cluster assembly protein SufD